MLVNDALSLGSGTAKLKLRAYQDDMVKRATWVIRGGGAPLIVAPTGSGKTELAIELVIRHPKWERVLFITSRSTLIEQTVDRFVNAGVEAKAYPGIKWPNDEWPTDTRVLVTSNLTPNKRWLESQKIAALIVDEAHHAATADGQVKANNYASIAIRAGLAGANVIGMTATPCRSEELMGFTRVFTELVVGPSYRDLARQGWLAPMRVESADKRYMIKGGKVDKLKGDFTESGILEANQREILVDAPCAWAAGVPGKMIIFAVESAHASWVANRLAKEHGETVALALASYKRCEPLEAGVIGGKADRAIDAFRDGTARIIVSCTIPAEGFDVPAAQTALVLRPTMSDILWRQMAGRVSRPSDGKGEALIADWAGNAVGDPPERRPLGAPDAHRDWYLESRAVHELLEDALEDAKAEGKHEERARSETLNPGNGAEERRASAERRIRKTAEEQAPTVGRKDAGDAFCGCTCRCWRHLKKAARAKERYECGCDCDIEDLWGKRKACGCRPPNGTAVLGFNAKGHVRWFGPAVESLPLPPPKREHPGVRPRRQWNPDFGKQAEVNALGRPCQTCGKHTRRPDGVCGLCRVRRPA